MESKSMSKIKSKISFLALNLALALAEKDFWYPV